jgi:hypothetical protein
MYPSQILIVIAQSHIKMFQLLGTFTEHSQCSDGNVIHIN